MANARPSAEQIVQESLAVINRLTRQGIDVGNEAIVTGRAGKTPKLVNALGTFQPGNTTSFRVLTGGGNIDVTNLALRVTLQPQKIVATTTTNHLNETVFFKAARDNTNTESFYGAPLQVETTDMQTPAFILFNRHALIRNLTVQLNGTSLERYSGIFLEYGHKACFDRLLNGVLNEAPIFSFITESESILLEPYCQDQLRMYPLTSDSNIEIVIPLRDNVLVRAGIFYVGRAALELNVTFHTYTVMQKAFLQNPRTPDPTNGARITPNITNVQLQYQLLDRESELSNDVEFIQSTIGGIPRRLQKVRVLSTNSSGSTQQLINEVSNAVRGVMLVPILILYPPLLLDLATEKLSDMEDMIP